MGWLFGDPPENPITKVETERGSLVCVECGLTPKILYEFDDMEYCEAHAEAAQRRKQWKDEEELWKDKK